MVARAATSPRATARSCARSPQRRASASRPSFSAVCAVVQLGEHRHERVVGRAEPGERRLHLLLAADGEQAREGTGPRPGLGASQQPAQAAEGSGRQLGPGERARPRDGGERERGGLDVAGRHVPPDDRVEDHLDEPGGLVLDAEQEPGSGERGEHAHDDVGTLVLHRLAEREDEVLLLAAQVRRRGGLVPAHQRVGAPRREAGRPALHGLARRARRPGRLEPEGAELAHRLEHPVAHDAVVLGDAQQRLRDEPVERVEDLPGRRPRRRPAPGVGHGLRRLGGEAVREDGDAAQQVLLGRAQQVPAPLDHRLERAVPVRGGPVPGAQEREALVEVTFHLLDAQGPHARRGELDGERQPVEAVAQPRDDGGRQARARPERVRALDEEAHGGTVARGRTERLERVDELGGEPERRPARREHHEPGRRAEQVGGPARGAVEDVLAVVQHEQRRASAYPVEHLLAQLGRGQAVGEPPGAGRRRDAQAVGQRHDDVVVRAHARELDDDHQVDRAGRRRAPRDLLHEARLAETAGAEDGHEPGPRERVPDGVDVLVPADERVRRRPQATHRTVVRPTGSTGGSPPGRGPSPSSRTAALGRTTGHGGG